jgi:hypothetical protein
MQLILKAIHPSLTHPSGAKKGCDRKFVTLTKAARAATFPNDSRTTLKIEKSKK